MSSCVSGSLLTTAVISSALREESQKMTIRTRTCMRSASSERSIVSGLIVVPVLVGGGMQLTPALGVDARLTLETERRLPSGAVEIVYACA
jgi:hypothetical protein